MPDNSGMKLSPEWNHSGPHYPAEKLLCLWNLEEEQLSSGALTQMCTFPSMPGQSEEHPTWGSPAKSLSFRDLKQSVQLLLLLPNCLTDAQIPGGPHCRFL